MLGFSPPLLTHVHSHSQIYKNYIKFKKFSMSKLTCMVWTQVTGDWIVRLVSLASISHICRVGMNWRNCGFEVEREIIAPYVVDSKRKQK